MRFLFKAEVAIKGYLCCGWLQESIFFFFSLPLRISPLLVAPAGSQRKREGGKKKHCLKFGQDVWRAEEQKRKEKRERGKIRLHIFQCSCQVLCIVERKHWALSLQVTFLVRTLYLRYGEIRSSPFANCPAYLHINSVLGRVTRRSSATLVLTFHLWLTANEN